MAVIDGKWLSKEGLTYFWSKIKSIFITMPQAYGDGTLITSDSDLDSYTTPGLYYATVAVARTLTNVPYSSTGFRLTVEKNTLSGADVFQTLTPTSRTFLPSEYKRVYEGGSWGPWYQFTKQTETNVIANLGAKNMLKVTSKTQTINGVTFTVNDDQTITVNGTNTGTSTALFIIEDLQLPSGIAYTLSGCPSGGSTATYYIGSLDTTNWDTFATDTGNGGTATLSKPKTIRFRIGIRSGVTVNNLLFKPMLRRAEITDSTFQPYAPTNRELYETRFASKTILPNNVDLNDIKTGGIYNGVNSTGNSAVHMPVATGSFNFVLTVIEANEFVIQIFKQLNSAGDSNLYIRRFYIYNSDWDSWYRFAGTQV